MSNTKTTPKKTFTRSDVLQRKQFWMHVVAHYNALKDTIDAADKQISKQIKTDL